jgi:UDP-N-acetylmuramoylalanine-D-glutamate ligase
MRVEDNSILIAGMGVTGAAVARYLDSQAIDYATCNDSASASEQPCADVLLSASSYVI